MSRLQAPRGTHVALRVTDIEATIAWYEDFIPLRLLDRRTDDAGHGAWLGHPEPAEHPFVLVVAQFFPERDPYAGATTEILAPFSHLGIELPTRADVDAIATRGEETGCLAFPPSQLPAPIGYICTPSDPDGNLVELSFDQGISSRLAPD